MSAESSFGLSVWEQVADTEIEDRPAIRSWIVDRFQAGDRRRGDAIYSGGDLEILSDAPDEVQCWVYGRSEAGYRVRVSVHEDDGRLSIGCECPRFASGYLCKHLWAVLVTIASGRAGMPSAEVATGARASSRVSWRERLSAPLLGPPSGPSYDEPGEQPALGGICAAIDIASMSARTALVGEGLLGAHLDLRFVSDERLETSATVPAPGERATPVEVRPLALSREQLPRVEPPEMQALAAALHAYVTVDYTDYGRRGSTLVRLPATVWASMLPRLSALGRLGWLVPRPDGSVLFHRLRWDDGAPWRIALDLERRDDDGARLTGRLVRGDESLDAAAIRFVLEASSGSLVCFGGVDPGATSDPADLETLAFVDQASVRWAGALSSGGPVDVPAGEVAEALEMLHEARDRPALDLPDAWRWPEVDAAPSGCLSFGGSVYRGRLEASVSMVYEGLAVDLDDRRDQLVDRDHGRIVRRDRAAEAALVASLEELGFSNEPIVAPDLVGWGGSDIDWQPGLFASGPTDEVWLKASRLDESLEPLLERGWLVELEGGRIERGTERLAVRSAIDWFDLALAVDFDSGSVGVPELLQALRDKRSTVDLGDGRRGFVSSATRRRLASLAALAVEEIDGGGDGSLRFRPSQAMLLDLLLEARDDRSSLATDERFDALRRRLRDSRAVEPADEPPGFVGTLRPYQRFGVGWMRWLAPLGLGGCLADDMGLGKTIQVLALLEARREDAEAPSLIVVPATLVENWRAEAARFTPDLQVGVYHGPGRAALLDRLDELDLVVTTYGTLRRDIRKLVDCPWDYAILDEAQAIKNPASQTAKACRLLEADHRLGLTGTPIENHLGDLWSLFEFLTPGLLGRLPAMQKAKSSARAVDLDAEALESIARALRPLILRRTKAEVLDDLPPKIEQTLVCELSGPERKRYDELRDHYRRALSQKLEPGVSGAGSKITGSKIVVLEALLRLRQAAIHPGLLSAEPTRAKSAKISLLLDQLEQVIAEGHKALVFSQFVRLLDILGRELDRRGWSFLRLDGRTRHRQQQVDRFQSDPEIPLFLVSLKAGGTGLNLTAASYVFLLDPWWNPATEAQAIDRAHRIGQRAPVTAYRLIARDTVEEKIVELQDKKRALADAIVARDESIMKSLTTEDLELLLG